jgi:hypothetical protein
MAWAGRKEGDRLGVGPVTEQVVESFYQEPIWSSFCLSDRTVEL